MTQDARIRGLPVRGRALKIREVLLGDDGGFFFVFDEHVDHVIVHKRHLPAKTLSIFKTTPVRLPIWYWD